MTDAVPKRTTGRRGAASVAGADAAGEIADAVELGLLGESVGFLLKRAQMVVFADFIRTFAERDLRPAQFSVLVIVGRNPGLKQSQVSNALNIKRTNFVPLLDSLEDRGLVKRKLAAGDRRSHALHLTAKGAALLTELQRLWAEHERRVCEPIGEAGREQLLQLLGGMIAGGDPAAAEEAEDADLPPAKAPPGKGRGKGRGKPPAAER
ncbi:MarR family transcriptional regulator [Azospirillum sp. TSO35-2]|uniref:MarR family winged helix-turn-helix transcriptional regulator n=1 Tax=Azospirillum sp. TSO35-2 TaxID=716796 RepID=UPI000D649774|nr:MarR family transcriptional regulator [Azospirillum sp. TSO35-2]